ncbi:hypothetical protein GCM10028791_41770 [Echinicola sediminis]
MSSNHPLITVIMPVYNGEVYLSEAISSVLKQTYSHFEFIIINDGSKDNSQKVIESFDDPRIIIVNQNNMGVSRSLNKGVSLARGEYIWRHDADDFCLPDQLEKQLNFLKEYDNFGLVSTQVAFMTDRGKIAYDFKQPKDSYFKNKTFVKVKRKHFNPYSPITHATVLIKKEVFNLVGGYRTEFKTSEDTDLWLRILEHYDVAVLNYCSYFVRMNATSATQVFKGTTSYYRDLAFELADERAINGNDRLQRGVQIAPPIKPFKGQALPNNRKKGEIYRKDLLDFSYKVMLNAKDYRNTIRVLRISVIDGWRLRQTWKAILFPLLGNGIVETVVSFKKMLKI